MRRPVAVTTAVLLAGGRGRRLQASDPTLLTSLAQRRAAAQGLKVLMPVGREARPMLDFALARLRQAGISDVIVVAPPDHAALDAHLARHPVPGLAIRIAVQPAPTGTAAAVAAAAPHVESGRCLVVNGDNLYPVPALRALAALDTAGLAAFTRRSLEHDSGFAPARIAAFARVDADAAGWLTGLHEKPAAATLADDSLISMNLWCFDQAVLAACGEVAPSARGEHELPDAVMLAVGRGTRVRVVPTTGAVLDLTSAADVTVVSRALDHAEVVR